MMVKINQNIEEISSKPRQARALTIISGIILEKKMFSHDLHIIYQRIETLLCSMENSREDNSAASVYFYRVPGLARGWGPDRTDPE